MLWTSESAHALQYDEEYISCLDSMTDNLRTEENEKVEETANSTLDSNDVSFISPHRTAPPPAMPSTHDWRTNAPVRRRPDTARPRTIDREWCGTWCRTLVYMV